MKLVIERNRLAHLGILLKRQPGAEILQRFDFKPLAAYGFAVTMVCQINGAILRESEKRVLERRIPRPRKPRQRKRRREARTRRRRDLDDRRPVLNTKQPCERGRHSRESLLRVLINARRVVSAPVVVVVANDDRDGRVAHAHAYGRGLSSIVVFVSP